MSVQNLFLRYDVMYMPAELIGIYHCPTMATLLAYIVTDPLMSRRWAVFTVAESLVFIVSFFRRLSLLSSYKKKVVVRFL
jgi:hypothetical protein